MLSGLVRRRRRKQGAAALYAAVVAQSRQPVFYSWLRVPDTIDGRFDLVALHAILLVGRLRAGPDEARRVAQELVDSMFADLEHGLRELGVSDQGLPRRMRAMASGFLGRMVAYDAALAEPSDQPLINALRRNLWGTVEVGPEPVETMAAYVRAQHAALARQEEAELIEGRVVFRPLSES